MWYNSYMKNRLSLKEGFTLVELMIVIAIIALLTGIIMTNLTSSRAKSRDGKRISDLGQIQLALSLYYDRCKQYPIQDLAGGPSITDASNCPTGITLGTFIATVPTAPDGKNYDYFVDNATKPADYVLHTTLEFPNTSIQNDSFPDARKVITFPSLVAVKCYDKPVPPNPSANPLEYCLSSR